MNTGTGKGLAGQTCASLDSHNGAGFSHRVQFYEQDSFLLDKVLAMVRGALESGTSAVVIGTRSHLDTIDRMLEAGGFDVDGVCAQGLYVRMNAAEMMGKLTVGGRPDPALFDREIGDVIWRAAERGRSGRVSVYGEMVALSMARGERELTLGLEELWNDLGRTAPFSLLCGYPLDLFSRLSDADVFQQVCSLHSQVTPAEGSAGGSHDERQRSITYLQHRAKVLEGEIAQRERSERELSLLKQGLAHLQAELDLKNAQLSQADRYKNELFATLGHELRNPLSAVNNALSAARQEDQRERALEIARRQTSNLVRLVDQLLEVSRLGEVRIELKRERICLAPIVESALHETASRITASGHDLSVSIPPEARTIQIDADPVRVQQVIAQMLSNSAKFTPPGGKVEVRLEQRGDEMAILVRDSGIGIASDLLPYIFDPLVQAESSSDRPRGGLGTGLTMVKALVQAHSGRVLARSDGIGKGSEFEAAFPIADGPGLEVTDPRTGAQVLVVEDNIDAAESLAMILEMAGHQVRVVNDGFSAVDAARTHAFDVFLVDIGLPGIDGYEVARRLRHIPHCAGSRMVALTGYGRDDDRREALSAGFDYHLTKPIDPDRLQSILSLPIPSGS